MKKAILNDGFNYMKGDADFEHAALTSGITDRSKDMFGAGGFISGAVVTINISNPDLIDISAAVGYDSRGERLSFSTQTGFVVPDLTGGLNWILVSYQNFDDTQMGDPVYGTLQNTRTQEVASIEARSSFTPGDADTDGNPFVPIALVTKTGSLQIVQDGVNQRFMLLDLKVNTVDTNQIVNEAVTPAKLARYLRQVAWTDDPGLYYDSYSGQLKMTGVFSTNPTFYMPGNPAVNALDMTVFPLTCSSPSYIVATETTLGSRIWMASAMAVTSTSFATDGMSKDQLFLGYVNNNGIFENAQASVPGEIVLASEDESQTGTPRAPLHKNLWRRSNELFRSYTSNKNDGVAITNSHQVTFNVGDGKFKVAPGVSYVAGRRFRTTSITTITNTNTVNYPPTASAGPYGLWILREAVGGKQFSMSNATLPNAYRIATILFDGMTFNPISVSKDDRVFTPFIELDEILLATESVLIGAGITHKDGTELWVDAGVVGFPGGQTRKNSSSKAIRFTNSVLDYTVPQLIGSQDQDTSISANSAYGIFAVADHEGTDFNVVAVPLPVVSGVVKTGPDTFSVSDPSLLSRVAPGQRVRLCRADYRSGASINGNYFSSPSDYSDRMCYIETVTGSNFTVTSGMGPTTSFSNGLLQVLEGVFPLPSLVTNYRFLGAVVTDSSSQIVPFIKSGDAYLFTGFDRGSIYSASGSNSNLDSLPGSVRTVDPARVCPGPASSALLLCEMYLDSNLYGLPPGGTVSQCHFFATLDVRSGLGPNSTRVLYTTVVADGQGSKIQNSQSNNNSSFEVGLSNGLIQTLVLGTLAAPPIPGGLPYAGWIWYSNFALNIVVSGYRIDPKKEWRLQ